MLEDNRKQTASKSFTNKYKKNIPYSYCYKLACVDDKFSEAFRSYLGEDAVYNYINSMTEERKYCSEVMKKHFYKELVIKKRR